MPVEEHVIYTVSNPDAVARALGDTAENLEVFETLLQSDKERISCRFEYTDGSTDVAKLPIQKLEELIEADSLTKQ